jgi:glutaredoxin
MTTICPKCQHVRPADATVPDWQCPACGICYAKFGAAAPTRDAPVGRGQPAEPVVNANPIPWAKWLLVGALFWGGWIGLNAVRSRFAGDAQAEGITVEQMAVIAAAVEPGDIRIYTTSQCVHCHEAKSWLSANNFKFTECNMSTDSQCIDEFKSYKAFGTPFLVVKGHEMHDGFDSDEMIAALKKS